MKQQERSIHSVIYTTDRRHSGQRSASFYFFYQSEFYQCEHTNGNFGASDSRNLIHPVLVTNSYGVGLSVAPNQYLSSAVTLQCKANDTYSIGAFAYPDDVSEAPFNVISDGRIECTKALFLQSKTGETSSNIYMYGPN